MAGKGEVCSSFNKIVALFSILLIIIGINIYQKRLAFNNQLGSQAIMSSYNFLFSNNIDHGRYLSDNFNGRSVQQRGERDVKNIADKNLAISSMSKFNRGERISKQTQSMKERDSSSVNLRKEEQSKNKNNLESSSQPTQPLFLGYLHDDSSILSPRQYHVDSFLVNGSWKHLHDDEEKRFSYHLKDSPDSIKYIPQQSKCRMEECHHMNAWVGHRQCKRSSENQALSYEWISESYNRTVKRTRQSICNTVRGRNIFIVGDSLNRQLYQTMMYMLDTGDYKTFHINPGELWCKDAGTCASSMQSYNTIKCPNPDESFNVTFARRVKLSDPTVFNTTEEGESSELPWLNWIRELNASILLINRGAWYSDSSLLFPQIKFIFDYLRQHYPNLLTIWRDTPYGHYNPDVYFNSLPLLQPLSIPDNIFIKKWSYHEINEQAKDIRKTITKDFPWITYMSVLPMTSRRVDSHLDALHYCIPSVIDEWVLAFFEVIAIIDQQR